jgi:hypothetical protein
MDYDAIAKAGSMLGSGAVIVLDEGQCMVKVLERMSYFYIRILRPVHPLPRGHRLAGAGHQAHPRRPGSSRGLGAA